MAAVPELEEKFRDLRDTLTAIPEIREPPKTTFQVIGHNQSEQAWNSFLAYFLDPEQPHGFNSDILTTFLDLFRDETDAEFDYTHSELPEITVDQEVSSPNGNRPDLVIKNPGEWFLCVECKVASTEGTNQTHRYLNDEYIGSDKKSQYPDHGRHYLYLSKAGAPNSIAPEFLDLNWRHVIDVFQETVKLSRGRYPARSISQLDDFTETITGETTMGTDNFGTVQREKTRLLAEYRDEIDELFDAVETLRTRSIDTWPNQFLQQINERGSWDDSWNCDPRSQGQIYRNDWRLDDDLQPTTNPSNANTLRLQFVHLIRNQESFRQGKLTYQLRCPTNTQLRDEFQTLFNSDQWETELTAVLDANEIAHRGGSFKYTSKTYSVDQSRLPESYFETLCVAFEEHQQVATVVSEILSEALVNYQATP